MLRISDTDFAKKYDYKFLLGILNSNFINWYFRCFLSEGLHFYPYDAKELPIPDITPKQQISIIEHVENILTAKFADPDADTTDLENEIDKLVSELYNWMEDEIAIVEGSVWIADFRGFIGGHGLVFFCADTPILWKAPWNTKQKIRLNLRHPCPPRFRQARFRITDLSDF